MPNSIWVDLQIFEQFCPKARNANPLVAEPKQILMQNGHSRSFEVIYFGVIDEPLRDYIAQCNNCDLKCDGSEDFASETSENRHSRRPRSRLKPPFQRTPVNTRINLILLETAIFRLHCCR